MEERVIKCIRGEINLFLQKNGLTVLNIDGELNSQSVELDCKKRKELIKYLRLANK